MPKYILFIDGENFIHKVEDVLREEGIDRIKVDLALIDLNKLFKEALKSFIISRKIFYASRLHLHPDTKRKSEELIKTQRKLRNNLLKLGYEFVIAGNVRAQNINGKVIFREKGVDVKIAVDLVALACDKKLDTAILCSSDSDLQPAVKELKVRGIEIVYLGFETNPNKGLTYTTNRTILLRNPEVITALHKVERRNLTKRQ
ncbi:NYN domain-containing protein [Candidatus Microgenomates bacterium]|nr:NYN domain-containing protein [Candidatus Microgenomates bacterium]